MNRVCLIGRLGRDPEVRTTTTGHKVAEFSIAVNRRYKSDDGPDADWFRIKAWGKTAEFVGEYLSKGRLVSIDGRIETRKWTDKEGQSRETVEIIAEAVQGLDRPKDDQGGGYKGNTTSNGANDVDEYDPFADD